MNIWQLHAERWPCSVAFIVAVSFTEQVFDRSVQVVAFEDGLVLFSLELQNIIISRSLFFSTYYTLYSFYWSKILYLPGSERFRIRSFDRLVNVVENARETYSRVVLPRVLFIIQVFLDTQVSSHIVVTVQNS